MPAKKKSKVTSDRLKTYLDAKKHPTVLLGSVDQYLQTLPNDRDSTVIHPSEMAASDWCHRATWHRIAGHASPVQAHNLRTNLIFAEGHSIHAKWQKWLADMGILFGVWKCRVCDDVCTGWSDEVLGGAGCKARTDSGLHLWQYQEVPVEDAWLMISGHSDGIINPTGDESLLLEVKSIGPGTLRRLDLMSEDDPDELSSDKFPKISQIMGSHFRQTQIYMRIANDNWSGTDGVGQIKRAVVLYEHKADQQAREFVITYNPRWTDELFEAAGDIKWALDKDRDVPCPFGGCAQCRAYELVGK